MSLIGPIGPAQKIAAVVHERGGAHPSPVQGQYNRDHESFHDYHAATQNVEGWERWLCEWILDVPDRATYLAKLGEIGIASLKSKRVHTTLRDDMRVRRSPHSDG